MNIERFRQDLLTWFSSNARDLPWRRTRDPYRIWLSETMLQQTRAAAAIPYYERFLEQFPDVESLARASESEVLAAWSGLGYYHRARNLHNSAQRIVETSHFPQTHDGILSLPGVGAYTAAAVGSIAFGLPHAVLDGNVLRVVARLMADPGDIGSGKTRRRFQETVDRWLDAKQPGAFNQAMMELGATICLPRNPQCLLCPVAAECEAKRRAAQSQYPIKTPKAAPKTAQATRSDGRENGFVLGVAGPGRFSACGSRTGGFVFSHDCKHPLDGSRPRRQTGGYGTAFGRNAMARARAVPRVSSHHDYKESACSCCR